MSDRLPAVFFGHGSPANALETNACTQAWAAMAQRIGKPKAILCVSAHWETRGTAVTAMTRPRTIHDFGRGLPAPLFDIQYPASGDPELAARVAGLLRPLPVALDVTDWGLDHGAWSVLCKAYPSADVPVVQLSMDISHRPAERFEIGRRLAPLRDEGVLLIGSGNIVHNLPAMNWGARDCPPYDWASRFNDRIRQAIVDDAPERVIVAAESDPDLALAAPSPEHFWPLLYVLGARLPGDRALFDTDLIEHGSLSMTSLTLAA